MQVFQGIEGLAAEFDVSIAGGDTNSWSGPLVISITLLGSPGRREPVRRSGAADGDWLMVTGRFGGSRFGRHLTFQPRVHEARKLAECAELHAMIDVSDGLAADLHHILDESRVAGIIEEDAVPISDDARNCLDGRSPLEHALGDGEDFELLFTVSETDGRKLLATQPLDVFVSRIGRVLPGSSCQLVTADGTARTLARLGYSHPIS